jgi:hypothetical protein
VFLARKITRAKWTPKAGLEADEVPADAVTADLRTTENTLSFWRCGEGAEGEVEEAALAIAAGGDRLDKLDVVWLSDEQLRSDGQTWKDTDGRTPVKSLVKQHVDLYRLDYVRLGRVADGVVDAIECRRHRRLTKKHITKLLAVAVEEGRVALADLEEKVQSEVVKILEGDGK